MIRNFALKILIGLITITLLSCSSDDSENNTQQMPSFIIVGKKDNDNGFLYDYQRESQSGELMNLAEQQIPANFNSVDFKEDVLCFVSPQSTSFKNIRTDNVTTVEIVFDGSNGESAFINAYSSSHIFSAYRKMVGSNDMYIRSKNIFDNTQVDIPIAKADRVTGLLYSQNRLVISYFVLENQETSYYVSVLNTVDNSIVKTLQFDATVQFMTTDNRDDLVLGYPGSSSTMELKVYTLNTMELLGEYSSDTFFTGVNDGLLRDNTLFYLQGFPQPSAITFLPSIFNIETNTSNSINILPAIETYAQNNDIANISVINGVFDINNNTVLVSANITTDTGNSTTTKAGVFLFDFNGNMLSNILIDEDFSPFYIFLK